MSAQVQLSVISDLDKRKDDKEDDTAVAFEKALTITGFGKFQWCILLATGLAYLTAGFQTGMNAYVMPAAACDLHMSSHEKGLLNAIFLIGGIVSAFFWGVLADQIGRRKVLWIALLLDGINNFFSSFSQDFQVFAIFRFFDGFLVGAPSSLTYTYLGEFIGEKQREKCLCLLGLFWNLSWLLLPSLALGVLPIQWHLNYPGFIFNSWRLYILMLSLPAFVSSFLLFKFFPETPKYLFSQGYASEALNVMERMYTFNYGQRKGPYPVKRILDDSEEGALSRRSIILDPAEVEKIAKSNGKSVEVVIAAVFRQILSLFRPPHINATLLSTTLLFVNMFGYVGLGLWLPELFDRFENHYKSSNASVTVCELMALNKNNSQMTPSNNDSDETVECVTGEINVGVFFNTIVIAIVCLAVNMGRYFIPDSVGSRTLSVVTLAVPAATALAIYFLRSSIENLIVASLFLSFVGLANNILTSAVCEMFPTRIRAQALCAALFFGRVGAAFSNLLLGYTIDSYCEVPIFLMSSVLGLGAVLAFLLPKNNGSKNRITT